MFTEGDWWEELKASLIARCTQWTPFAVEKIRTNEQEEVSKLGIDQP